MRRRIALTAIAALALASVPAVAVAGKGGNPGKQANSIAFWGGSYYEPGDQVSFAATGSTKTSLWVANLCRQDGKVVYEEYQPVSSSGVAGPFTLSFSGAAECTAYTWSFPDAYSPIASMSYSVD